MPREIGLDKFLTDLEQGVHDHTVNGKCIRCGECCSAILPVTNEEIKRIKAYIKKKRIKPTKVHNSEHTFDCTCPFYDEEKKECRIYEVRPSICSSFLCSYLRKDIENNKKKFDGDNRYHTVYMRDIFNLGDDWWNHQ